MNIKNHKVGGLAIVKTLRCTSVEQLSPHWTVYCPSSVLKSHLVFSAFCQLILKFFSAVKSSIQASPEQSSLSNHSSCYS